ncbi:MAG: hypothetical protein QNJ04_06390 [Desulfobacterales bacterium]|nr:hypothetical protein [Desulfobacterales bacterium]
MARHVIPRERKAVVDADDDGRVAIQPLEAPIGDFFAGPVPFPAGRAFDFAGLDARGRPEYLQAPVSGYGGFSAGIVDPNVRFKGRHRISPPKLSPEHFEEFRPRRGPGVFHPKADDLQPFSASPLPQERDIDAASRQIQLRKNARNVDHPVGALVRFRLIAGEAKITWFRTPLSHSDDQADRSDPFSIPWLQPDQVETLNTANHETTG